MRTSSAKFIGGLRARTELPSNVQLVPFKCGSLVSIFSEAESDIITESVFSGMDRDAELAVLKGLVEFVERRAFVAGRASHQAACQTKRSDGFAAFPRAFSTNASEIARCNALSEAIERYVWASWWDDDRVAHEYRNVDFQNLEVGEEPLLDLIDFNSIERVIEVRPRFFSADRCVLVYFAFFTNGGVVSGGACGFKTEIDICRYRALGELLRHGLAIRKMNENGLEAKTFYEQRLSFFGNGTDGASLVLNRVGKTGTGTIHLPKLQFDEEIPHDLSDSVVVHRCYFENQPDFVGGKLERLCL